MSWQDRYKKNEESGVNRQIAAEQTNVLGKTIQRHLTNNQYKDSVYINQINDYIDDYERNMAMFANAGYDTTGYKDTVSAFRNETSGQSEYYGQFANAAEESEFRAYTQTPDFKFTQKYSGSSYDDVLKALEGMDELSDEYEWLNDRKLNYMTDEELQAEIDRVTGEKRRYVSANATAGYDTDADYASNVRDYNARLEKLRNTQYYREQDAKYGGLSQEKDFAEESKRIDADRVRGLSGDLDYKIINNIDNERDIVASGLRTMQGGSNYGKRLLQMTDDEIAAYNYLYNTQGKKAAKEYIEYLTPSLNAREMGDLQKHWENLAEEAPFIASVGSTLSNATSGLGFVDVSFQNARNIITGDYRPIDYNTPFMQPTVSTTTIRGTISENIADKTGRINIDPEKNPILASVFNGKSLGDVYQLGMSMMDSVSVGYLPGGTILLGGAAASQGMLDAVSRGASDSQAWTIGLLNGIAEAFFERVSLENLYHSPSKGFIKDILIQGGFEGSEEAFTSIANTFSDVLVMMEKSDYKTAIREYMKQGYTEAEATRMVFTETALNIGVDAFGGFLSGGILGGTKAALNQTVLEPQSYARLYSGSADALVAEYNELNPDGRLADGVQSRINDGKYNEVNGRFLHDARQAVRDIRNGRQLRGLVNANEAAMTQSDFRKITEAASAQLSFYGEKGNTDGIAFLIAKQVTGEKLTKAERDVISGSRYAQRVINELDPENIRSGEYSTEWAERIGTDSINAVEYGRILDSLADEEDSAAVEATRAERTAVPADTTPPEEKTAPAPVEAAETGAGTVASETTETISSAVPAAKKPVYIPTAANTEAVGTIASRYGAQAGSVQSIYNIAPTADTEGFSAAFDAAYRIGLDGGYESAAVSSGATQALTEMQRRLAYATGKAVRMANSVRDGRTGRGSGKGVVRAKGMTTDEIKKRFKHGSNQLDAYRTLVKISEITGLTIELYDSAGDFTMEQGRFDRDTDVIAIDINAGLFDVNDVESLAKYTMLRTFCHEFTHFGEKWAAEEYNILRTAVIEALESNDGYDLDKRIREMQKADYEARKAEYIRDGKSETEAAELAEKNKLSWDMASREVVAEAMTDVLPESDFIRSLYEKSPTLADKVKDALKKFLARIKQYFSSIDPNSSPEANALKTEMDGVVRYIDGIVEKFDAMALKAVGNYQSATEAVGAEIDTDTESVNPTQFSLRTWNKSEYVQNRDEAAKEIAKAIGVSESKAKEYIDSVNSVAYMIARDKGRLDYTETGLSPFVSNAEYGGSFDYTTLCKKRRLLTGTFSAIQNALKNTALTAQEILEIRKMMDDAGLEVSCGKCYVEGSRANMGKFTKQFIELYKKYHPGAWYPNMAEMNTPDGIEWVRITHPEVYEQYEYFWNHYGTLRPGDPNLFASQQKPKLYQMRSAYDGEILDNFKNDGKIDEKNRNGGIRMQSFSDFEIVHLIDAMQTIMDMSRVGLYGQAYTKVPDFAWALGNTGMKINLSIDAWAVDENGNLIFNNKEGMPFDTAMELRNAYSKNVGTICCVYDDVQLLAALADDRIDFIIPFHRSQWKKSQYKSMGLPATTKDYTYQQNEKWLDPSKHTHEYKGRQVATKCTNYMPNEYWDFSKTGKENAEEYLRMCFRDGKRPKFYKFLDRNSDGSFSLKQDGSTDGYWKLLIDFKMYDNDGVGSPQTAVRPDFNMEQVYRMLNEYEGGHQNFPVAQGIVDEFVDNYKKKHPDTEIEMQGKQYQRRIRDVQDIPFSEYNRMEEHFGTTKNYDVAGYLLRDGEMLDFSGKHWGDTRSTFRQVDHRDIQEVLDDRGDNGVGAMVDMISNGNIRLMPETGGINLSRMPNGLQAKELRGYINHFRGEVVVDIDEYGGDTVQTFRYNNGTSSSKVLSDIEAYFRDGTIPDQPSDLMQFHTQHQRRTRTYSDREVLQLAADVVESRKLTDGERDALRIFNERLNTLNDLNDQMAEQRRILAEQKSAETPDKDEIQKTLNRLQVIGKKVKAAENLVLDLENKPVFKKILKESRRVVEREQRSVHEERADRNKYRKRVTETAKKLTEWLLRNSDKEHIPEVLKGPVAELLTSINFSSERLLDGGEPTKADKRFAENIVRLNSIISGQQSAIEGDDTEVDNVGAYLDISGENRAFLDELEKTLASVDGTFTVNRMTSEQLKGFSKFLTNLEKSIREINKTLANARYQNLRQMSRDSMQHFENIGNAKTHDGTKLVRFIGWTNATPYYALRRFGAAGEALFDGFARGWEKLAFNAKEVIDFTEKTYSAKEVREWKQQIHDITLSDGSKIRMTTAQIMELSQLVGRDQAMKHITAGGIRIGNIQQKNGVIQDVKHYHLTDEDLQKVIGLLTNRQREVAEQMRQFMARRGRTWGNEISLARFGYEFYVEGDEYYPIRTDANGRPLRDTDEKSSSMFRLLNLSASKPLNPNAKNALIVGDIFDTLSSHMADMAKLNALALPLLDAIKWFNYTEKVKRDDGTFDQIGVKNSMEKAFGTAAQSYFRTLLMDINGVKETTDRGGALNLISNYKIAAVAANIRVALLQPTSYVRAMYIVKPKHLISALMFKKNAYKEAMKYSGTAVWKSLGYYDTDISRGLRSKITHDDTALDAVKEKSMFLAEFGDQRTWGRLWVACKLQVKESNPSLEGEELNKATADLFRETIYATQVMDSTLTRSEMMRGTTRWTKLATAFMAEPTLSQNMLMDAASQFVLDSRKTNRKEALAKNRGRIGLALTTYVASAAAAALVESLVDAFRDDDDYETFLEKFLQAFFGEDGFMSGNLGQDLTVVGKIPVLRDILDTFRGNKRSDMSVASIESITNAFNIWRETWQLSRGIIDSPTKTTWNGKMTQWGKIYKSLQALSQISGLAVSNMTRDVVAIWNTIFPEHKVKTYDPGDKNSIRYAYSDGYLTEEEAIEKLIETEAAKDRKDAFGIVKGWESGGSRYSSIYDAMLNDGNVNDEVKSFTDNGYKMDDIVSSMRSQVGKWYYGTEDEEPSISAQEATKMLTKYCGMSAEDAKERVREWGCKRDTGISYSDIGDALVDGEISQSEAERMWVKYGGKTADEAHARAQAKVFEDLYPGWTGAETALTNYNKYGKETGISEREFTDAVYHMTTLNGTDSDGDGKADRNSVRDQKFAYINSLNISPEAKDALARTEGYTSESTLRKAPWNG